MCRRRTYMGDVSNVVTVGSRGSASSVVEYINPAAAKIWRETKLLKVLEHERGDIRPGHSIEGKDIFGLRIFIVYPYCIFII